MWSLKSVEITPIINSAHFTATFILQAQGSDDVSLTTTLSSRAELENTIRQNIARLNERSALIAEAQAGTFTLTELTVVEETPEQAKEREIQEARAKVEQGARDLELKIITQEEYDALVADLKLKMSEPKK